MSNVFRNEKGGYESPYDYETLKKFYYDDLKQLAELKAEVEELCKNTDGTLIIKLSELQQQLKERDEEIEKLKDDFNQLRKNFDMVIKYTKEQDNKLKSNTHQVCEKIREEATAMYYAEDQEDDSIEQAIVVSHNEAVDDFIKILDQIESEKNK